MDLVRQALITSRGERSQVEVAQAVEINQRYLSKLELGKGNPSAKVMARLAQYYQKPVEYLFPDIFFDPDYAKIEYYKKA